EGAHRPLRRGRLRRGTVRDTAHRRGGGDGQPRPLDGRDAVHGRENPGGGGRRPFEPRAPHGGGGGGGWLADEAARDRRGGRGSPVARRPGHVGPVWAIPYPSGRPNRKSTRLNSSH